MIIVSVSTKHRWICMIVVSIGARGLSESGYCPTSPNVIFFLT